MRIQIRSLAGSAERRRIAVVLNVVCALVCLLTENRVARTYAQAKSSVRTIERFRFQLTDFETDIPISQAAVCLVYWQKKATSEEKKEMEVKTDANGLAEFPRVEAGRLAVSVEAKGYRSCWRWMRANSSEEPTRVRLERWTKSPK